MFPSLYTIKAIIILDSDGLRIVGKYYDDQFNTIKEQKDFEKMLFSKTNKGDNEIVMLENLTIVYKNNLDLFYYVVGSVAQNEIMLGSVLNCLFDSLNQAFRKNMDRKSILDGLDSVYLTVDEICMNGVLLETDPHQISTRVSMRENEVPLAEQSVMDVVKSARDQLKWSILR